MRTSCKLNNKLSRVAPAQPKLTNSIYSHLIDNDSMNADDVKNEFDDEPVYYCTRCLSLAIIDDGEDCYCKDCMSTKIKRTNIYRWLKMKDVHSNVINHLEVMKDCNNKLNL